MCYCIGRSFCVLVHLLAFFLSLCRSMAAARRCIVVVGIQDQHYQDLIDIFGVGSWSHFDVCKFLPNRKKGNEQTVDDMVDEEGFGPCLKEGAMSCMGSLFNIVHCHWGRHRSPRVAPVLASAMRKTGCSVVVMEMRAMFPEMRRHNLIALIDWVHGHRSTIASFSNYSNIKLRDLLVYPETVQKFDMCFTVAVDAVFGEGEDDVVPEPLGDRTTVLPEPELEELQSRQPDAPPPGHVEDVEATPEWHGRSWHDDRWGGSSWNDDTRSSGSGWAHRDRSRSRPPASSAKPSIEDIEPGYLTKDQWWLVQKLDLDSQAVLMLRRLATIDQSELEIFFAKLNDKQLHGSLRSASSFVITCVKNFMGK